VQLGHEGELGEFICFHKRESDKSRIVKKWKLVLIKNQKRLVKNTNLGYNQFFLALPKPIARTNAARQLDSNSRFTSTHAIIIAAITNNKIIV